MNLRILKKLSKRAAPLLRQLGDNRQQFTTGRDAGESSWDYRGFERKSYDRFRGRLRGWLKHMDGIPATGAMTGYYEPEWEDVPCWFALKSRIVDSFGRAVHVPGPGDDEGCAEYRWEISRKFPNPSAVFRAIPEVMAMRRQRREG